MVINSDSIAKNSTVEGDICIIGAGAAGISMALRYSNLPQKIIILESGKEVRDAKAQNLNDIETAGLPIEQESRIRVFGGTTTVWSGRWKPYDKSDFEKKDWLPYSGWPITLDEIAPFYEESARLIHTPELSTFSPRFLADAAEKSSRPLFETRSLTTIVIQHLKKENLDFGKKYKSLLTSSNHIDVLLDGTVVHLESQGGAITAAQVKTFSGNTFTVNAKVFVLACGGIENARILLLSSIGNEHDQVGRYYMDHPKGPAGSIVLNNQSECLPAYFGYNSSVGYTIAGVGITEEAQKKERVLNSYVLLHPKYKRAQFIQHFPKVTRVLIHKILKLMLGNPKNIVSLELWNYMEQAPIPENRITLGEKKDVFGNPLPKITWNISETDKKTVAFLHKALKEECEKNGLGILKSPLLESIPREWPIHTDASHHTGTTRMGDDPNTSVVDKNCRVHSMNNLYIAGSSVFPTSGNANPTYTITALAIRLADHLHENYFS